MQNEVNQPEMHHALEQAIEQMAPVRKRVFKLSKVEGYSYKEIAEMLGISENTSKSQLFKARKQLQEQLGVVKRMKNER